MPWIIGGGILLGLYFAYKIVGTFSKPVPGPDTSLGAQFDKAVDAVLYISGLMVWTWAVGGMEFGKNRWYVRAVVWVIGAGTIMFAINYFASNRAEAKAKLDKPTVNPSVLSDTWA